MTPQHHLPADIERTSLSIITAELDAMGLTPPPETAAVVKRVIHTTADFDYARNLRFTPGAVAAGVAALQAAAPIVTDTNMALSTLGGFQSLAGGFAPDGRSIFVFALLWAIHLLYKKKTQKAPSPIGMIVLSAVLGVILWGV